MRPPESRNDPVFATPWFQIAAKRLPGSSELHYLIHSTDFVGIVATTTSGRLLLVRQFRPALGAITLELPGGHVDPSETPEQAARRELLEETGHEAGELELLADLSPSTGRYTNRLWCFFAAGVKPCAGARRESGVEAVPYQKHLKSLLQQKEFCSVASYGCLCVALLHGRLKLPAPRRA